ncbi:peptide ABC transporter ATP-binding protein [Amycolatopsis sp. AA4]|uniref:dipeptide ABC transporter ATP-binding protein n=1 Tax=Amycolatopsis sp. AA4 TaxID=1896961 RepID=UPI000C228C0A|nr:ABC transporter ATP-binding protein [Amycolatopsis sp. AA4]ATY13987.1 peptide ABC transporter ATP-binding protein [Amycolatopsis sp. AA4]
MSSNEPVLTVRGLQVSFPSEAGRVHAVRGVDLQVKPGQTLGIVGESGSGKSVTAMAVMGLLPDYATVSGSVELGGRELLTLDDRQLSTVRGRDIGMVFQDPLSSLTPIFTVGDQLVEALRIHQDLSKTAARRRAVELLDLVGIPDAARRARSFPHEFSGGMRQRVVIAAAIANNPRLIIADEPTTALDVTVQAQILDVLRVAQAETGAALILVTHDLGVVAGTADEVAVMYAGRLVETAPVDELFTAPQMPYTIGLLGAVPRADTAGRGPLTPIPGMPPSLVDLPQGCPFQPRCPIAVPDCGDREPDLAAVRTEVVSGHTAACVRARQIVAGRLGDADVYPRLPPAAATTTRIPADPREPVVELAGVGKTFPLLKGSVFKRRVGTVHAMTEVDLRIEHGESLGLVGESGCGKTTTLLEIMRMRAPQHGVLRVGGVDVASLPSREARRQLRHRVQMVFQDPMGSLDPRMTVAAILAEPLTAQGEHRRAVIDDRVAELMTLVGLDPSHRDRFPAAFSGGQRQRIGIARALATRPDLVVLDEPVSALDVSVQAGVINLLNELKAALGLAYLFVAHDLAVVRHVCDRVAVMYLGRIVETGPAHVLFEDARHPYTQALLSAVPVPDPQVERGRERIILRGDLPSPAQTPAGCAFASRCPKHRSLPNSQRERCLREVPALRDHDGTEHVAACHFP